MATVVRARGPRLPGRPSEVALKFLHRSLLDDKQALAAFQAEGKLGMHLRHESLCRTYGVEVIEDRAALVLEYVQGWSLHAIHKHLLTTAMNPEDPYVIAHLIAQVCRGLAVLHSLQQESDAPRDATQRELVHRGTVHRDVTPQNIIVDPDGHAKLIDFGIAFAPSRSFRTQTGLVKGKLAYLAPEYLQGKAWDQRIDIWSTGVVLWELLTGRRLFRGETPSRTVSAVVTARVPSPAMLRASLPPSLCQVALRALERNLQLRYTDAAELARELEQIIARECSNLSASHVQRWIQKLPLGPSSRVVPKAKRQGAEDTETKAPQSEPTTELDIPIGLLLRNAEREGAEDP